MEKFPQPTIRTSNISGECLRLLNLPIISSVSNLKETLNKFIEPPSNKYIQDAIKTLIRLGLIENDSITILGKCVAEMQVDPSQGVTIYAGYNMNCVKEVIAIISMCDAIKNNISGLFITPQDLLTDDVVSGGANINERFNNAKKSFAHKIGDHLSLLRIFSKYVKLRKDRTKLDDWLYKSFLRRNVLEKAVTYFKKIRGTSMKILSSFKDEKNRIENIMSYDTNIRVMSSILFGYGHNVGFHREKNYATEKVNNVTISRDSWMAFLDNPKKEVIYNELFIMNKKTDMLIVSHITSKIRELCDLYNLTQTVESE
jgi:HrpA-like RNA helicase